MAVLAGVALTGMTGVAVAAGTTAFLPNHMTSSSRSREKCVGMPAWSSSKGGESATGQVPGFRLSHTSDFHRNRASINAERRLQAEPRLDWLLGIAERKAAVELAKFIETARNRPDDPPKSCAFCSARISEQRGKHGDADPKQAKICRVCSLWYCERCCSHREDVAQFSRCPPPQRLVTELECCERCHKRIDAVRWQRDPLYFGLKSSSQHLLTLHEDLHKQMNALASALAQLDGLSRTAELHRDTGFPLPDEIAKEIEPSCARAKDARKGVEDVVMAISKVQCPAMVNANRKVNDSNLRDALAAHGNSLLVEVKPQLHAALVRTRDCQQTSPGKVMRK